jgi:uncharacterized membrane protein YoaK (UPF0700 family)
MGVQAATARLVAVKDVTTVVVTSTLTALAADSSGGAAGLWRRRAPAVALMLLGAAAGTGLLRWNITPALLLSSVVTAGVAVVGHRATRG